MSAYSTDIREWLAATCDGTCEQIAVRISVSVLWVGKLLRQRRDNGAIGPRPHDEGCRPAFGGAVPARLREAVRGNAGATL